MNLKKDTKDPKRFLNKKRALKNKTKNQKA